NSGVAGHVELVGAQPHEKIPEYMSAADLLVLPSWYEGNARVLAEAALTGLPAVATDVSGARDTVIHGETGWVVSPGDPEALAEGVLRLLRDDGLRREMGARGRAHVAALSEEERLLDRFQAMCEETVKRWRGAR
ncbi:MAG: glycosyltransferase family 4 protein, partial [Nitrospinota bacterium]